MERRKLPPPIQPTEEEIRSRLPPDAEDVQVYHPEPGTHLRVIHYDYSGNEAEYSAGEEKEDSETDAEDEGIGYFDNEADPRYADLTDSRTMYRPAYDRIVRNMRMLGYSNAAIARVFGINVKTLREWRIAHPLFQYSWECGGVLADGKVARSLYRRATGYKHRAVRIFNNKDAAPTVVSYTEHYPPDTNAAQFWLVNRQPELWKPTAAAANVSVTNNNAVLAPPSINIKVIESERRVPTINARVHEVPAEAKPADAPAAE